MVGEFSENAIIGPGAAAAVEPRPLQAVCPVSPWLRLGLCWNPFGEPPPEDLAALIVSNSSESPEDWLRQPCTAQQYLGDAGRGKTARLRRLGALFPDVPYLYLAEDAPPPAMPHPATASGPVALLLDEAQRLPARRRRRLFAAVARARRSLVLATHVDLSGELGAAGLACRTAVIAGLGADDLLAILHRRIAWAQADHASPVLPQLADAQRLIVEFGDDVRAILDHLYGLYQAWLLNRGHDPWQGVI
jgi:hypothetical protein